MKPYEQYTISLFSIIFGVFFCLNNAFSQADIDRATQQVDRNIREEVADKLHEAPEPPPKIEEEEEVEEAAGPKIYVAEIRLVGTESYPPEEFNPLIQKYEGRDVTRQELDILSRAIQRDYLRKGIIAACFIPPQDVVDGIITLRVVEAKMGEVIVKDHQYYDTDRLLSYWTIKPGEVLRYDEMSRNLQIMNTNPDRELRATLHAGKKPQTTDVLLDAITEFPIHLTASFDLEGGATTGRYRKSIGMRHNNFLNADDTLMIGYTYGSYFSNIYVYHRVPITNFGTSVMYGYSYSKSAPKKDQEYLGLSSIARNSNIFLYQDYYHKNEYIGDFNIGIDFKDKAVKLTSGVLNKDRLRVLRIGSKLRVIAWGGVTYISPKFSQGLNILGARRKHRLSSRRESSEVNDGIENTFSKFNLDVQHKRRLPFYNLQLSVDFKSQISDRKLASQEQFGLGGINSIRGYPSGDFSADDAFATSVEIMIPSFFIPPEFKLPYGERPIRDDITGIIFMDYGHGERKGVLDATIVSGSDRRIVDFSSIGAGIRIRLLNQALMRIEWGYPIGGDRAKSETAPSRLHFSIDFEDSLPREIARFQQEYFEEKVKAMAWEIVDRELQKEDSIFRKAIEEHLASAKRAEDSGDLEAAKEHYEKIRDIGESLYKQAEEYVFASYAKERDLREKHDQAKKYFTQGKLSKAKKLWQSIINESKPDPLVLTY